MKAKFTRADEGRLGIRFEPQTDDEQLLLEHFTRESSGFLFSFSGFEQNGRGREVHEGLTSVWGQLVKAPKPEMPSIPALDSFVRRVAASTKHGPRQTGSRGHCEPDCLKCEADLILKHLDGHVAK